VQEVLSRSTQLQNPYAGLISTGPEGVPCVAQRPGWAPRYPAITLGDYGYVTRKVDEKEVLLETPHGGSQIAIRLLEQDGSGIYVCVEAQGESASDGRMQRVRLLKQKDADALLKSRESGKEFNGCPAVGGEADDSRISMY
jgi:hypothetical protein